MLSLAVDLRQDPTVGGGVAQQGPHRRCAISAAPAEPAGTLLADRSVTLATLDLARYEVANVAVRAWRAPESVAPLLAALDRLADDGGVIASTSALLTRAAELAERHAISAYDAAYVAAAGDAERSLVSCDARDLVSKGLAVLPEAAAKGSAS
jgi:predicted nucleic acid-binding protein